MKKRHAKKHKEVQPAVPAQSRRRLLPGMAAIGIVLAVLALFALYNRSRLMPAPAPAVQTRVPPVPSGWAAGTTFTPPPPVAVGAVPDTRPFNMLANPGFENGTEPWWYFPDRPHWGSFTISTARALRGQWSARVELRTDAAHPLRAKGSIQGMIQSVQTPVFPARVSGNYYVETWVRSPKKMYLQCVVIATGTKTPDGAPAEISYLLGGIDQPPFNMVNRKFILLSRTQPELGRWLHFERDLRQDFKQQWGFVPEQFSGIRIFFELRTDMREEDIDLNNPPAMHAIAYFDDLYLGN